MTRKALCRFTAGTALALVLTGAPSLAAAQTADEAQADAPEKEIIVTGSRIVRTGLTSTSPIATTTSAQLQLDRALTIEDFSNKLPQLAAGANNTMASSDAYGAQTLDLRNLGQNRTLVLINGTRATPFSFRNSVDVNAIPATLLKQVDVLTGGAAAVYGADAVAGVVNFILNDDYEGIEANGAYKAVADGASQYGGSLTYGTRLGDRGHVVAYVDYTQRNILRAGDRSWAMANSASVAPAGGKFTDVASGNSFYFDPNGALTATPQTTNYTGDYPLVMPLKRINGTLLYKYDLTDGIEMYGRGMFSRVKTTGSSTVGSQPVVINETVGILASNPYLTDAIRNRLTFVDGVAQVNVNRSLGELGIVTAETTRKTWQGQLGFRGRLTPAIKWDVYGQYGRVEERTTIHGDGIKTDAATGKSYFSEIANSVDIFGPNADGLAALGSAVDANKRVREQIVGSATLSGTTDDFFRLPAGPVGFALGYEYRKENGTITVSDALTRGLTYRSGTLTGIKASFETNELFGELLVPLIHDAPFIKMLSLEGAYRISDYSNAGTHDTWKLGANWQISRDIRLRGTRQTVIRAPNMGEFAGDVGSLPFSYLVSVARLNPRYAGDPCALGTGDAAQCARFGAPAAGSYDSKNAANLVGGYYYGGNADIKPERGTTWTLGTVITPRFLPGFSLSVDYYDINLKDAVGVIQPVDALTSCYITNPAANNPLCAAVTRDPATGYILNGYATDRNLARIVERGLDIDASYSFAMPAALPGRMTLAYQAAIVTHYTIQRNEVLNVIDCKGTYGSTCSSDSLSLVQPDYKHRASVTWTIPELTVQFGWQRIGKVRDSAVGGTGSIAAQDYFDLNFSIHPIAPVTLTFGVSNLFDKQPPLPTNYGTWNTYPGTYDVLGRTVGLSLRVKH